MIGEDSGRANAPEASGAAAAVESQVAPVESDRAHVRTADAQRVVLFGKPGCHLCDVAREIVELVCAEQDLDFDEVNIYEDPSSADLYAARVPVVTVDGREVAQFRISPEQLRAALA